MSDCDPFKETFQRDFQRGGIACVEMLFRCNILALVGGGRNPRYPPNKVMIWDDHQNRCIGELSFRSEVRAVKLRRDRVVVVLEYKIYVRHTPHTACPHTAAARSPAARPLTRVVLCHCPCQVYNFADLKLVDHIETTQNTRGLCALCPLSSNTVLVCPGLQKGHVRCELYDAKKTTLIEAHESALAAFALNFDGSRLATASETGTLIRIFDTATGSALQEVRRGADKAEIYSIAFSPTTQWLACSSDRGTIHIFALRAGAAAATAGSATAAAAHNRSGSQAGGQAESKEEQPLEASSSAAASSASASASAVATASSSVASSAASGGRSAPPNPVSSLSFMRTLLPKYFSSEWSFAQFRVPDVRTIVAFGGEKNSIVVASADGTFYKALFDPDKPGGQECVQDQTHTFTKQHTTSTQQ